MATPASEAPVRTLEHYDCVSQAATEMFGMTCGLQLRVQPGETQPGISPSGMIIAVISLMGDVEWSIFLGLPRETAKPVVSRFAGFDIDFDSADMGDAVGELTNIFAGTVKAKLDQRGLKGEISLPSVMRGDSLHILAQREVSSNITVFESDMGFIWTGVLAGKKHSA